MERSAAISIRLLAVRGLSIDSIMNRSLHVSSIIEGVEKKSNDVILKRGEHQLELHGNNGFLKWELTPIQYQSLKSKHPRIRVDLFAGDGKEALGFALLDSLDFAKGINQQWFRVQNGRGEMKLSAHLQDNFSLGSPKRLSRNINSQQQTAQPQHSVPSVANSIESALSMSNIIANIDSSSLSQQQQNRLFARSRQNRSNSPSGSRNASAVVIPPAAAPIKSKYSVHIMFEEYNGICELLRSLFPSETNERKFWLSWVILGQTFQSSEFTISTPPKRVRDTIHIRVPSQELRAMLSTSIPFQCCLCSSDALIIAVASIDFAVALEGVDGDAIDASNSWSEMGWFALEPLLAMQEDERGSSSSSAMASLRIGIAITSDRESSSNNNNDTTMKSIADHTAASPSNAAVARSLPNEQQQQLAGEDKPDNDYEEDQYGEEDFEQDELNGSEGQEQSHQQQHSQHQDRDEMDRERAQNSSQPTQTEAVHNNISSQQQQLSASNNNAEGEESFRDEILHHFRVSIEVRTIANLRKPSHVLIAFAYPHLGSSSSAVRTTPLWIAPFSEVRLNSAVATFDCCMSTAQFLATIADHPLKISILSKSQLGTSHLGDCIIDLHSVIASENNNSSTNNSKLHSVRDPVGGKSFKSLSEYLNHRRSLIALRNSNINATNPIVIPPIDPIKVYLSDGYIGISPNNTNTSGVVEGAQLRVISIVEDMGVVGGEIALPVKKGYQQQFGALYDITPTTTGTGTGTGTGTADAATATTSAVGEDRENNNNSNEYEYTNNSIRNNNKQQQQQFRSPLLQEITPELRDKFNQLMDDWTNWQRQTESDWREQLRNEEKQLRKRLETEMALTLAQKADDLKRGQEEVAKLEIRLREKLDTVDRHANALALKEDKLNITFASKSEELQLLQKRLKDEFRMKLESESRKATGLEATITSLQQQLEAMERRAKESEKDFENYRYTLRHSPEHILREENAKLKAILGECRAEVERERTTIAKMQLEEEHAKTLIHKLALELKREREKTSIIARQDLEQMRLHFLANEERNMLDGDRNALLGIRNALASLQISEALSKQYQQPQQPLLSTAASAAAAAGIMSPYRQQLPPQQQQLLQQPAARIPINSTGSSGSGTNAVSTDLNETEATRNRLRTIQQQLTEILSSGLYTDRDPLVQALVKEVDELTNQLPNQDQQYLPRPPPPPPQPFSRSNPTAGRGALRTTVFAGAPTVGSATDYVQWEGSTEYKGE